MSVGTHTSSVYLLITLPYPQQRANAAIFLNPSKKTHHQPQENSMSGPDTGSIASNNTNPSDTEDKLNTTLRQKSRQTAKRKRRATGNNAFGETLLSLLQTEAPSNLPLALKPSFVRKRNNEKLEEKARKLLQAEKKEKQDQARVTDLIGGWGGEGERALRKVAQRGGGYLLRLRKFRAPIMLPQWSNSLM